MFRCMCVYEQFVRCFQDVCVVFAGCLWGCCCVCVVFVHGIYEVFVKCLCGVCVLFAVCL